MSLSKEGLQERRSDLLETLQEAETNLTELKEQVKDLKAEIANTKGAILELNHHLQAA